MAKPSFSIAVITRSPKWLDQVDTVVMFVGLKKGLVASGIPYMTLVDFYLYAPTGTGQRLRGLCDVARSVF